MGFRWLIALTLLGFLVLGREIVRRQGAALTIRTSVMVLAWPTILLVASNAYAGFLLERGCLLPQTVPWKLAGLALLAAFNVALLVSLGYHVWRTRAAQRALAELPMLPVLPAWQGVLPDLARVELRLLDVEQPTMFTLGGRRPRIVLSTWMLAHLDHEELLAALAHELAHVRHRDSRLLFWIHALCPGGWGLETMRRQSRHLMAAVERRADATGAELVSARLALASALAKVGRSAAVPAPALPFAAEASALRPRIEALMDPRLAASASPSAPLALGASALGSFVVAILAIARLCGHAG